MFRLVTAVVTLLLGCLCSQALYVDIGTQLTDLGQKVTEELSKEILTGLKAADVSIRGLTPTLQTCLGSIETRQAECSQCINTSCRQRLDTLSCTEVIPNEVSPCDVSSPVCNIKTTVQKATTTLQTIEKAIKIIGDRLLALAQKVINGVKKSITDGSDAINGVAKKVGDGLNAAAESVKNAAEKTVNQVVNVAEKAASEVENAANKVAQGVNTAINTAEEIAKKAGKVIQAGAEEVADTVKDGVNAVKDFLGNLGRRRRLATQPTCDAFSQDSGACLFYQGLCEKCAVFGTNEAQSNILEVLLGVCGQSLSIEYDTLESLISKVDSMTNLAEKFVLNSVKFDPASLVNGLYQNVLLEFGDSVTSQTIKLLQPITPFDIQTAGPAIAKEIFNKLFS